MSWLVDPGLPAIFQEVADATPGLTAETVLNAVYAALDATGPNMAPEEAAALYRSLLGSAVASYAEQHGLDLNTTIDALVGAAQTIETDEYSPGKKKGKRSART